MLNRLLQIAKNKSHNDFGGKTVIPLSDVEELLKLAKLSGIRFGLEIDYLANPTPATGRAIEAVIRTVSDMMGVKELSNEEVVSRAMSPRTIKRDNPKPEIDEEVFDEEEYNRGQLGGVGGGYISHRHPTKNTKQFITSDFKVEGKEKSDQTLRREAEEKRVAKNQLLSDLQKGKAKGKSGFIGVIAWLNNKPDYEIFDTQDFYNQFEDVRRSTLSQYKYSLSRRGYIEPIGRKQTKKLRPIPEDLPSN